MALWFSDSPTALPMQPLGNGQLLLWEEGVSFYSLRAGYSAPHFCSLSPDFGGGYHEIDTARLYMGEGRVHRLYYSSQTLEASTRELCDLQITDLLPEGADLLIRRLDGISSLTWRLSVPSYVRTVFHPAYRFSKMRADTLFLTIPAGTPFESGLVTLREKTLAVVFCGSLRYDPQGGTVYYGGDIGEMYFLSHDDPKEMIRTAESLLQAFNRFGETPTLHPIYGKYAGQSFKSPLPLREEITMNLLSMQSASGAVVTSHREPYATAADLPALTAAFLRTAHEDDALRMLLFWTAAAEKIGYVPSRLLCGTEAVCQSDQSDLSATAAYLLSAVRCCREASPTARDADLLFRGMRSAFSALMQGFREGMLPFGGRTAAFEAGILGRELLFQGSSEVTALAIRAGQEFLAFCETTGRRAAKEEKGYRRILAQAMASYEKSFTYHGKICRNAPRLEGISRRPRFIRGVCTLCQRDGAYPFEDTLELDKYGRYLCRRCFATRRGEAEETDPAKRYTSFRATLAAALLLDVPTALAELPVLLLTYVRRLHEPMASLPMRESDADPLLLLALRHRRAELCALLEDNHQLTALTEQAKTYGFRTTSEEGSQGEKLLDFLTDAVSEILAQETEEGALSALLWDTAPLGARHAAGATALYLTAQT